MKVKDLKAMLSDCHDEDMIFMYDDTEDNLFPLVHITSCEIEKSNNDGTYDAVLLLKGKNAI